MRTASIEDDRVPNFCWDRRMTAGDIREQLKTSTDFEWIRLASWILREAAFGDVWAFLSPSQVREHLSELLPYLGRRKEFWQYLIGAWHELGRI